WLREHRSKGTYDKAVHYLSLFAKSVGTSFRVSTLDGAKVSNWLDQFPDWSPSTGNDAVSIIQRAFNWAMRKGHIDRSPVQYVPDKPAKTRRETVFSPEQWNEIRSLIRDQELGDFVDFMWETGCRPLEARTMEARHIDLKNEMVVFPPSESKGETRERVIFLSDAAKAICIRLMKRFPEGPIMRNTKGRPWTKDSINNRFQRIQKKVDFPVCAYGIRHSYATEGLKSGMDSLTVAQLMGHQDTSMISRTYSHLARNPAYLREQAKKLKASND
ncbi:MAG: tyrosine-type recombinase/integrase, partial [bacterium]|nr:tyrosine-type recombinase/integrase [bacterium]